ncbi:hypothetical protein CLU79DRAFT_697318, partial [Phycomyces nitens]
TNARIGSPFIKTSQCKLWWLVSSPVILNDILPLLKFENWMLFVNTCRLLTKPSISEDNI